MKIRVKSQESRVKKKTSRFARRIFCLTLWRTTPIFIVLFVLLYTPPVYAAHCDNAGNYLSLNQYCDPNTNIIWEDRADCSHADTGNACPAASATIAPSAPPPAGTTPTGPSINDKESAEEAAIRHLDDGLTPAELPQEIAERPGIIQAIGGFFDQLGTFINRMLSFVQNSKGLQAAEVPQEQVAQDKSILERITGFLGDEDTKGIYNNLTPEDQPLPAGRDVTVGIV